MKHFFIISIIIVFSFFSESCERLFIDMDGGDSAVETFDVFWKTIDEHYSYIELYGINWQLSYDQNRPLVHNGMTDDELWDIMTGMLAPFRDCHLDLSSKSKQWGYYSSDAFTYESLFSIDTVINEYLHTYKTEGGLLYGSIGRTGYIRIGEFDNPISGANIDTVIGQLSDTDGIVIDIRNNRGGDDAFANTVQSRFTSEKTLVEYIYYKTGPGHNDFSNPQKLYISPQGPVQYLKPVVVLTDRDCFSTASFFASRMSVLPNVTVVGEPTSGGAGYPRYFDLPNGWIIRYSSNYALRPDGYNFQQGVPVDHFIEMNEADAAAGIDTQLEYALSIVEGQ